MKYTIEDLIRREGHYLGGMRPKWIPWKDVKRRLDQIPVQPMDWGKMAHVFAKMTRRWSRLLKRRNLLLSAVSWRKPKDPLRILWYGGIKKDEKIHGLLERYDAPHRR
jgi:hypothetical protein